MHSNRAYKVSNSDFTVSLFAGTGTASSSSTSLNGDNGPASSATFKQPFFIHIDSVSQTYIVDYSNQRVRVVSTSGIISTIAGTGTKAVALTTDPATQAPLYDPHGAYCDTNGKVYIAENGGHIVKVVSSAVSTVVAGTGAGGFNVESGPATSVQLNGPVGVYGDSSGNIYVTEQILRIRVLLTNGIICTVMGTGNSPAGIVYSAQATSTPLGMPRGIHVDSAGFIHVSDVYTSTGGHVVRRAYSIAPTMAPMTVPSVLPSWSVAPSFSPSVAPSVGPFYQEVVIGVGTYGAGTDDVAATSSALSSPNQMWYSSAPKIQGLLLTDYWNNRVRKIDSAGIVTNFAGGTSAAATSVGMAATSFFVSHPIGVLVDVSGHALVVSFDKNTVYTVSNSDNTISVFAGTGVASFSGDNGPATSGTFSGPYYIHVDTSSQTYIADYANHRVRMISTSGIISTIAGNGQSTASLATGLATQASLYNPKGVYCDTNGKLYIAESGGQLVKAVASGIISVVAGIGSGGFNVESGPATSVQLNGPSGVYGDSSGIIYVTDYANYRVQAVLPNGMLITVMGTGTVPSGLVSSGMATSTPMGAHGTHVDSVGNIYIADISVHVIRRVYSISPTTAPSVIPSLVPSTVPSVVPSAFPSQPPSMLPTSIRPSVCPSLVPSNCPSLSPSELPTILPTALPSVVPSAIPSKIPSLLPSLCPSLRPSLCPTAIPSVVPSVAPTAIPSAVPTAFPSVNPSVFPSESPSVKPTPVPSIEPSVAPTTSPSVVPSVSPSLQPQCGPSIIPSLIPTGSPSDHPSVGPSILPTFDPTATPSVLPSIAPTLSPSYTPSVLPSCEPTLIPSVSPTFLPTDAPSITPSVIPSVAPSIVPSVTPSLLPVVNPSVIPSVRPSLSPTVRPTLDPSTNPSLRPTPTPTAVVPSISVCPTAPTLKPSRVPTIVPSLKPTRFPSVMPSRKPTAIPSIKATQTPVAPSAVPSLSSQPTLSLEPTEVPVVPPTMMPTVEPSASPTVEPSIVPTVLPTQLPSSWIPTTALPSAAPSTVEFYISHPKATLPSNQSISVTGAAATEDFKIVLPFLMMSSGPYGTVFSDIVLIKNVTTLSYVISGGSSLASSLSVASGDSYDEAVGSDVSKRSAAVLKDVNGDGASDLIIGDPYIARCYVVLGTANGLINMTSGFTIFGEQDSDLTGWSVSDAGDVNNDTVSDIIIGAPSVKGVGAFYVVYGRRSNNFDVYLNNLTASQGFAVYGSKRSDYLGVSVSNAGDVNGDGCDDVITGGVIMTSLNSGGSYVLFGCQDWKTSTTVQLISPFGFKLVGPSYSYSGYSVSAAGDVNKDGCDDILIGSSPQRSSLVPTAYLVYGSREVPSGDVSLAGLTSSQGARITGGGMTVTYVGDVNHDGFNDFMVGGKSLDLTTNRGFILFSNIETMTKVTGAPSVIPTYLPIFAPTKSPTRLPSRAPSVTPSRIPSALPSVIPTAPTVEPSIGATQPSSRPSGAPAGPTVSPSIEPSEVPSVSPSVAPSESPTRHPTESPSESPSESPTMPPSPVPTISTSSPTTLQPTLSSRAPFSAPTLVPSIQTTAAPTVEIKYSAYYITGAAVVDKQLLGHQNYFVNTSETVSINNIMGFNRYTVYPNPESQLTIVYFNNTNDLIDLTAFTSITEYKQLILSRGSVILTLPSDQIVHILNLHLTDISAANFVFYKDSVVDNKENKTIHAISTVTGVLIALGGLLLGLLVVLKLCHKCFWLKKNELVVKDSEIMIVVRYNKEGELIYEHKDSKENSEYNDTNNDSSVNNANNNRTNDIESPAPVSKTERVVDNDIESLMNFSLSSFTDKSDNNGNNNKVREEEEHSGKLSDLTLNSEGDWVAKKDPSVRSAARSNLSADSSDSSKSKPLSVFSISDDDDHVAHLL